MIPEIDFGILNTFLDHAQNEEKGSKVMKRIDPTFWCQRLKKL